MRHPRIFRAFLISGALSLNAGAAYSAEQEQPSGTVDIDEVQVMLILGGDHGHGTLHYKGKDYRFKASGLKVGGVGVHKMDMTGEVYHLDDVDHFDGLYVAAEAGADIGKGASGIWLKNDDGTVMHLHSKGEGIALAIGVEGFDVSFVDH